MATHRRGNHDLGASVLERVVGRGELLEALTPVFEQGTLKVPKINGWRMDDVWIRRSESRRKGCPVAVDNVLKWGRVRVSTSAAGWKG